MLEKSVSMTSQTHCLDLTERLSQRETHLYTLFFLSLLQKLPGIGCFSTCIAVVGCFVQALSQLCFGWHNI